MKKMKMAMNALLLILGLVSVSHAAGYAAANFAPMGDGSGVDPTY